MKTTWKSYSVKDFKSFHKSWRFQSKQKTSISKIQNGELLSERVYLKVKLFFVVDNIMQFDLTQVKVKYGKLVILYRDILDNECVLCHVSCAWFTCAGDNDESVTEWAPV